MLNYLLIRYSQLFDILILFSSPDKLTNILELLRITRPLSGVMMVSSRPHRVPDAMGPGILIFHPKPKEENMHVHIFMLLLPRLARVPPLVLRKMITLRGSIDLKSTPHRVPDGVGTQKRDAMGPTRNHQNSCQGPRNS